MNAKFNKQIKDFMSLSYNFSFKIGICVLLSRLFSKRESKAKDFFFKRKHEVILSYLKKHHEALINRFACAECKISPEAPTSAKHYIWVFWWQGEEELPELVNICINSMKEHSGDAEVVIVSRNNLQNHINLPPYILEKVEKGIISLTHLSDIVRVSLLARKGGLWLDATVWVAKEIPQNVFDCKFYSIRLPQTNSRYVSEYKWAAWLLAATKNNIMLEFVRDFLYEYWVEENEMIDYLLVDYVLYIAYMVHPDVRISIDTIPMDNIGAYILVKMVNNSFELSKWEAIVSENVFYKLSRKMEFVYMDKSGNSTFYSVLTNKDKI